jgi:hypothetical protein
VDKENCTYIPFFIQLGCWILFYASLFCVILGFRRGVDEICTILGYYAAWAFKMGSVACAETSVQNYHSTLHKIPEEQRSHLFYLSDIPYFIRFEVRCFVESYPLFYSNAAVNIN